MKQLSQSFFGSPNADPNSHTQALKTGVSAPEFRKKLKFQQSLKPGNNLLCLCQIRGRQKQQKQSEKHYRLNKCS